MRRFALLSPPVGNKNLGDEATVAAVISNIRQRVPAATISVFSANPEETRARHNVAAFPVTPGVSASRAPITRRAARALPPTAGAGTLGHALRRSRLLRIGFRVLAIGPRALHAVVREIGFVVTSYRRLRDTDFVILTGSGVLSDHFGGPLNFPYTLLKWSLLARVRRARLVFLSVGAGPIGSWASRRLLAWSLRLTSEVSARDRTSRKLIRSLAPRQAVPVLPDLVYSLDVRSPASRSAGRRIGINVFPHGDPRYWPLPDTGKYQRYLTILAAFVTWLSQMGYEVVLFPTQLRADPPAIEDLRRLLAERGELEPGAFPEVAAVQEVDDLLVFLKGVHLVVATRFHAIVLASLLHRPVLALANHHKMSDLMTAIGLSEYVLDIESITVESLVERFLALEQNSDVLPPRIADATAQYQKELAHQYDLLLGQSRTQTSREVVAAR